jgi:hypothetical protein
VRGRPAAHFAIKGRPVPNQPPIVREEFSGGYAQRVLSRLPKQRSKAPFLLYQSWLLLGPQPSNEAHAYASPSAPALSPVWLKSLVRSRRSRTTTHWSRTRHPAGHVAAWEAAAPLLSINDVELTRYDAARH